MEGIEQVILYSLASGVTVIIGGFIGKIIAFPKTQIGREISHGVVAFGGGILVAAVAFVLAPRGLQSLSLPMLIFMFFFGVFSFLYVDRFIQQRGERAGQLLSMLMDFVPEAAALGAVFSSDKKTGLFLALFIGVQNLPEAFNSFRDLVNSGFSSNKSLLILAPFSLVGVIAAVCGYLFLVGHEGIIASLMVFSAGAILYLVFQDIAPMAKLRNHWMPTTGATLGFMLGMIGEKVLGNLG